MVRSFYSKMTEKQLRGRKVRLVHSIRNGNTEIPAGAVLTIRRKFSGLALTSSPCETCGVKVYITKVGPESVELLPEGI